ncbi:acetylornithine deacetylase, partial [Microbacterium sp. SUBG005]
MTPVERFRELLSVPTVSRPDPAEVDDDAFVRFRAALERLYPLTHAHLDHEVVQGHSLLYHWRGASAEAPLLLLAHQDVVPVDGQSWRHAPFAAVVEGEGADAVIHARGAIDDKGALVAVFEAVEEALAEGVVPRTDVWLAFGHDEETHGTGARAMAGILAERGVRPSLVLDEGGAVVDGAVPGVAAPTAMIGVAERGVATFDLVTREAG